MYADIRTALIVTRSHERHRADKLHQLNESPRLSFAGSSPARVGWCVHNQPDGSPQVSSDREMETTARNCVKKFRLLIILLFATQTMIHSGLLIFMLSQILVLEVDLKMAEVGCCYAVVACLIEDFWSSFQLINDFCVKATVFYYVLTITNNFSR